MTQLHGRAGNFVLAALFGLSLAVTMPPAFAMQNDGGGDGGRSMDDILADGYQCIAQDPKTGNVWCVRGHGEGTYICTPNGTCYPSGPGSRPPWPATHGRGPAGIPGVTSKGVSR